MSPLFKVQSQSLSTKHELTEASLLWVVTQGSAYTHTKKMLHEG